MTFHRVKPNVTIFSDNALFWDPSFLHKGTNDQVKYVNGCAILVIQIESTLLGFLLGEGGVRLMMHKGEHVCS